MTRILRLRRASAAGAFLAALLFATACEPTDAAPAAPHSSSAPAAVSSSAAAPTPTPSPTPTPTPPATTPAAAPPTTEAPTTPAAAAPATTRPAAPRTTTAAPQPPATPTHTEAAAGCHPLSNAGNCYKAGQYCRATDHNVEGTDASGRAIRCLDDSGWRWKYV
ncbi:hypothetical protein AB0K51_11870 [Kitasatospora sp. NPDC049285]|uniref:hypothetical protein n=1 Tax=Kitasatospora sp. NPDC049285 TaxID=3157096 RepID=UPI00343620D3